MKFLASFETDIFKKGGSLGIWTWDLPQPKPMITHSTPRLWRCQGQRFCTHIDLLHRWRSRAMITCSTPRLWRCHGSVSVPILIYRWWRSRAFFIHVIQWVLVSSGLIMIFTLFMKIWECQQLLCLIDIIISLNGSWWQDKLFVKVMMKR